MRPSLQLVPRPMKEISMNRLQLAARIVETVILAPILFLIATRMGDRIVLGSAAILVCLFLGDWLRNRIVSSLAGRRQRETSGKTPPTD